MKGYLISGDKSECVACGACEQICKRNAIDIIEDKQGFFYPVINTDKCVNCGKCHSICPLSKPIKKHSSCMLSYGGYIKDAEIRQRSTSGGAFTAICKAYCQGEYVIYGAVSDGLNVLHKYVKNVDEIEIFHSSKYAQSIIGNSFNEIREKLRKGIKVIFSGTPCQIAGLYSFLGDNNVANLLTVEVLCTGIPSALFMKKYDEYCVSKYGKPIKYFNYRYTNINRWDDQPTMTKLEDGKTIVTTRWFSNFYSIFLQRLMSRPSCNSCQFVSRERVADITLSDLWGVDREYPDLYGDGSGCSWIICNTKIGVNVFAKASEYLIGHDVDFEKMRKYQRPGMIEKTVHQEYEQFMEDLVVMDYMDLCKKWAQRPNLKLLYQKYIYNNRNRVRIWKLKKNLKLQK